MQRVKARAPSSFKAQVNDTEKRLNILFDHLNNEDLLKKDTISSMVELSQAIQARDFEQAQAVHVEIMTNKTDECGNWMVSIPLLLKLKPWLTGWIGWSEKIDCNEPSNSLIVHAVFEESCVDW